MGSCCYNTGREHTCTITTVITVGTIGTVPIMISEVSGVFFRHESRDTSEWKPPKADLNAQDNIQNGEHWNEK